MNNCNEYHDYLTQNHVHGSFIVLSSRADRLQIDQAPRGVGQKKTQKWNQTIVQYG
jgi:hypothetical protein